MFIKSLPYIERVTRIKLSKRNWVLRYILTQFPDTMYFRSFYNESSAIKYLSQSDVKYQLITHI